MEDRLIRIFGSAAAVALATGAIYLFREAVPVLSLGVLYLFAVLPVAVAWGRLHALAVAVASMLAFNFFFLPPTHTFRLQDRTNWFALAVYVVTAIVVSELAARSRRRAAEAEQREREEALLAELSIALLQGERITQELDRLGAAIAGVLDLEHTRIELGAPGIARVGESAVPLLVGERTVGAMFLPVDVELDASVRRRFIPALASLLGVALDRARLEREALEAERLRLSDSVKTTILRAASHDLRSPLTAIRVAAESLVSPSVRLSEADRQRQLETVRIESARLDRLVSNLLDLSRLEADAATPERALIALDDLIGQALAQLDGAEHTVQVELPAEVPLVEVDPMQVERALVNLLENAVRFTPAGGQVTVQVTTSEDEAILRVIDRGPGIAADELERVFEPFAHASTGGDRQGSGLGLAIARGFAEANGGRTWAESEAGQGAMFALAFPLALRSEVHA